ncbi:MAG: hypothetical protein EXS64_08090 [Candidatus Latescibacteria bacterium]|nr:hypothetical protein [Candidatus Latescibacterota bacterium]
MSACGTRFRWVTSTLTFCLGLSLASVTLAAPRIEVTGGAPTFRDAALKFAPIQTAPVTIQSFSPSPPQITAAVGDTLRFSVTATPPAGTTLTYRWRVNGSVDSTATTSQYTFRVGGAGAVAASVSNGQSTAEQTWTITIRSGNTIASDFDGDGDVDFDDFFAFAAVFGKKQGEAGFDAKFDLRKNGTVDFDDFFIFADDFGKKTK